MKIAVTGATGFLGNAVVKELTKQDLHTVILLVRQSSVENGFQEDRKVSTVEVDIESCRFKLNPDLFEFIGRPDLLIHLAWKDYKSTFSPHHLDETIFDHYRFLTSLYLGGLRNISVIGTAYEYGSIEGALTEDVVNPITPYGVAKDGLHRLLKSRFSEDTRMRWLRPFNVYGEGQHSESLLGQLETAIRTKQEVFRMSKGEQIRDFVSVNDAARQIVRVSLQDKILGAVNICSGIPISVRQMVEQRLNQVGSKMKLDLGFYSYSKFEPMRAWGDTTKLNLALAQGS